MMNLLPAVLRSLGRLGAGGSMVRCRRVAPVLLLVLALVSVQTLGLLHRVVHAPAWASMLQDESRPVQAQGREAARAVDRNEAATGFLAQLFAGHQSGSDCRSYDQLSHGDCVASVLVQAMPLVLPVFLVFVPAGVAFVRRSALFQARGPPVH